MSWNLRTVSVESVGPMYVLQRVMGACMSVSRQRSIGGDHSGCN